MQQRRGGGGGVRLEPTMKHGPVSGPINGSLTALALTVIIWAANRLGNDVPVWLPLAFAVAGCVTAGVVTVWKEPHRPVDMYGRQHSGIPSLIFRCACWLGGGIWSHGVLTWAGGNVLVMMLILIAGTAFAGMLVTVFAVVVPDAGTTVGAADEAGSVVVRSNPDPIAGILEHFSTKLLNLRNGETIGFKQDGGNWPNDSGATYLASFSVGSSKGLAHISAITTELQQAMRLPDGCMITARRSGVQGTALVDVMFYNDMESVTHYPRDYQARSGKDDISIGLRGDKTCMNVNLLQNSAVIAGIRGGGKTILLHDITASMVQCRDVVVWHVDLNAGSISVPWCRPTAMGEINGHVIDWVAHTSEEALIMAKALLRMTLFRKAAYASATVGADEDVLPITPDLPMILVIVDEGGEAFGSDADADARAAADLFRKIQRIGRSVCVNIVLSVQRATSDYLPAAFKKMTGIKICLPVSSDDELAYMFDWQRLRSDDLLYKGCCYVKPSLNAGAPTMAKTYLIKPSQMAEICRFAISLRPPLDQPTADQGGREYRDRWGRPDTVAWMANIRGDSVGYTQVSQQSATAVLDRPATTLGLADIEAQLAALRNPPPVPPAGDKPASTGGGRGPRGSDPMLDDVMGRAAADINADLDRLFSTTPVDPRVPPPADVRPPFTDLRLPAPEPEPDAGDVLDGKEWCYRFIDAAGPEGTQARDILEAAKAAGRSARRQTVQEWMSALRGTTPPRVMPVVGSDGEAKFGMWRSDRHAA